jgi:hypothetical protein
VSSLNRVQREVNLHLVSDMEVHRYMWDMACCEGRTVPASDCSKTVGSGVWLSQPELIYSLLCAKISTSLFSVLISWPPIF